MMNPPLLFKHMQPAPWSAAPCELPLEYQKTHALFRVVPPDGKSLFTGYFEPVLKGSLTQEGPYQTPLYRAPSDLLSVPNVAGSGQSGLKMWGRKTLGQITPHFTRAEIENGALKNQNLELIYLEDPADVFFLHVQGSGKIMLPDGSHKRVRFAGKNGHPYTAIGAVLRNEHNLAPITMQTIKAWLRTHPDAAQSILNRNASFIFFDFLESDGPIGASGEVLQPEASLAIDDTLWPYGVQVIVETSDPLKPQKPLILLMKTHDCGSAIRGLVRGDIYFGSGDEAAIKAGAMNAPGSLWIILPKA